MCGIVGYYGEKSPREVIVNGLKALEYRGYDSAGVAILDSGVFKRVRAEGKLENLVHKLESESFDGTIGIGHTRWATHGAPVEKNAHPHQCSHVTIVHNGIIENYASLKEDLISKHGSQFTSDTDSELVAHLIEKEIDNNNCSLLESVVSVLQKLQGAYSILAVSEKFPNEMVAFKNGPPLIVGKGQGEVVVASDVQAIVEHTKEVFYLEDNEIAHLTGADIHILNESGQAIEKGSVQLKWNQEVAEKQGYSHFMLKEIYEQPRAVAQALAPHIDLKTQSVKLKGIGFGTNSIEEIESLDAVEDLKSTNSILKEVERVFIVACGTSYYAGMVGEYFIEKLAGVPVEVDIASEFRYRDPVVPKNSLLIIVSQSGETADTLAALRLAKKVGARTLSICNVPLSSIDRESHGHLYMNAGVEIGVASTKAFVSTISVLSLVALSIAKAQGKVDADLEKKWVENLLAAPAQLEKVLAYDSFFAEAAGDLEKFRGFLYMGRGVSYPIALEGALKLKELAYMHAEGYAAGEMKHGPLALIDESMAIVMLAPRDDLYEKTISNLEEAKARGGVIISIGSDHDEDLKRLSKHYLSLPKAEWYINPLLEVLPLQLLSFHVANSLGNNVDQPRNLAKSVTVE